MKTTTLKILMMASLIMLHLPAQAQTQAQLNRLQQLFAVDDAFSRLIAIQKLQEWVPPGNRGDAFSALWDNATGAKKLVTQRNLLAYTMQEQAVDLWQQSAIRQRINDVKHSGNLRLKQVALNIHAKNNDINGIEDYLQDADSELRKRAIHMLTKQPNARDVLQQYIETNKNNKALEQSIKEVEAVLQRLRNEPKE